MIHDLVKATLEQTTLPVSFHRYSGEAPTYITFHQIGENAVLNADDTERATSHLYQVNLFSLQDYEESVNAIKSYMAEIGATRLNEIEFFDDAGWYQRSIRFRINTFT